jgi:hypothetical protein
MDGECRMHEDNEKCVHNYGYETYRAEADQLGNPLLDVRIISKLNISKYCVSVWTGLILFSDRLL